MEYHLETGPWLRSIGFNGKMILIRRVELIFCLYGCIWDRQQFADKTAENIAEELQTRDAYPQHNYVRTMAN